MFTLNFLKAVKLGFVKNLKNFQFEKAGNTRGDRVDDVTRWLK